MAIHVHEAEREGDSVHLVITLEGGEVLEVMFEEEIVGDTLIARRVHVDGPGPGKVGRVTLRSVAEAVARRAGVRKLEVHGGRRTTGVGPGRVPRVITFEVRE